MKLVDTDILIDHLRGIEDASETLEEFADEIEISVLTRFELLGGMRSGERHAVRALVDAFPNRTTTRDIATQAGVWAREYRRSHSHIGPIDYMIAATASSSGADLLTRNVKHYPMFPDLAPPY